MLRQSASSGVSHILSAEEGEGGRVKRVENTRPEEFESYLTVERGKRKNPGNVCGSARKPVGWKERVWTTECRKRWFKNTPSVARNSLDNFGQLDQLSETLLKVWFLLKVLRSAEVMKINNSSRGIQQRRLWGAKTSPGCLLGKGNRNRGKLLWSHFPRQHKSHPSLPAAEMWRWSPSMLWRWLRSSWSKERSAALKCWFGSSPSLFAPGGL